MSESVSHVHKAKGPLLLLAGPGTGKTHKLAQRVKFLVDEKKIDPETVTVITFTAGAAANMRSRISDPKHPDLFVETSRQPTLICTMHSLGYRIIRENSSALGLPESVSVVQSDRTKAVLMADAAQLARFGRKDADATRQCRQFGECRPQDSPKCAICRKYTEILCACAAIDYDDQILLACRLLREHPGVAETWRAKAKHLLVDEYQDINPGQFELIRMLARGQEGGLFVVGDDDQSIYHWRGGSPRFIRGFEEDFGDIARVYPLRHSYRCHKHVLEGALAVVETHDPERRCKAPFSYESPDGSPIVIHSAPSGKREAAIVRKIVSDALPSKEVLILVPTRRHGKLICEQLRKSRIGYVAPEPVPGEGLPVIERLAAWLGDSNDSLALRDCVEAMLNAKRSPVPSRRVRKREKLDMREDLFRHVSILWDAVIQRKVSLWASLGGSPHTEKVLSFLKESCEALRVRWGEKRVPELLAEAAAALEPWPSTKALMQEVETWVGRFAASPRIDSEGRVRVMTFQGAKGLEADVVCIVGLEDGTIPRKDTEGEDAVEQSRLLFVSMTRAKADLHLFHARTRPGAVTFQQIHGPEGAHSLRRSPFLDAIPDQHFEQRYHRARKA